MHTLNRLLAVLVFLSLSSACQAGSVLSPPTPTVPPSPITQPALPPEATPSVDGLNEIPPGKYLFLEYWEDLNGVNPSVMCKDAAMIDFPMYSFSGGKLESPMISMVRGMPIGSSAPVGFFGHGTDYRGGMGGGASSTLDVIDALPYHLLFYQSYEVGILHSVDAQGQIVVELDGHSYLIKPGARWQKINRSMPSLGCLLVETTTLTNYGLLDRKQVAAPSDQTLESLQNSGISYAPYQLAWLDTGTLILAAGQGLHFYSPSPLTQTGLWLTSALVVSAAISPDKRSLVSADVKGDIQLWDIPSTQPAGELTSGPEGPWISLVFSPDGGTIASGSWDGIIQLWDRTSQKAIGNPWITHTQQVTGLEFTPDGKQILSSAGENARAQAWQVSDGTAGQLSPECVAMALSADGKKLACLQTDLGNGAPTLTITDFQTGQVIQSMAEPPRKSFALAFSPDGALLAVGADYGLVQLWDAGTGEILGRWTLGKGNVFDYVTDVAFSPDGSHLAAGGNFVSAGWLLWVLDRATNQADMLTDIH